jgi:two-component system chemotaxis sensor kinase CheA
LIGPVGEASAFHAQKRGKQIKLEVSGEAVRVPPSSVGVFDVLTHLLRNAIDHGVEEPLAREAIGKPAMGTIRIEVSRCGDDIELVISDDGAGIDAERVAASAVEKGVITAKEAETMSDDDKRSLIFEAGFSTSGSVTDTSGRGVGMSAVRDVVERLGGSVHIASETGVGTSMTVQLPGILDSLALAAG